jgi:hypothetical protein
VELLGRLVVSRCLGPSSSSSDLQRRTADKGRRDDRLLRKEDENPVSIAPTIEGWSQETRTKSTGRIIQSQTFGTIFNDGFSDLKIEYHRLSAMTDDDRRNGR